MCVRNAQLTLVAPSKCRLVRPSRAFFVFENSGCNRTAHVGRRFLNPSGTSVLVGLVCFCIRYLSIHTRSLLTLVRFSSYHSSVLHPRTRAPLTLQQMLGRGRGGGEQGVGARHMWLVGGGGHKCTCWLPTSCLPRGCGTSLWGHGLRGRWKGCTLCCTRWVSVPIFLFKSYLCSSRSRQTRRGRGRGRGRGRDRERGREREAEAEKMCARSCVCAASEHMVSVPTVTLCATGG